MNDLSRRELLQAFLGGSLAIAACKGKKKRRSVSDMDGELALRREKFGHAFRDAELSGAPSSWEECDALIVGGGVAGLSAAYRLRKEGLGKIIVANMDEQAGGTAQGGHSELCSYPWGAHYVTVPMEHNRDLLAFLNEAGAMERYEAGGEFEMGEQSLCADPEERVFYRGRWYEGLYPIVGQTAQEKSEKKRFDDEIDRLVSFRDEEGRRAFSLPMADSSQSEELKALDAISMGQWLDDRGYQSQRLRWWIDYACRDDYGSTTRDTSAWSALFYYAARKQRAGADYQEVVTWPNGNAHLVEKLSLGNESKIRNGLAVFDLRNSAEGVQALAMNADAAVVGIKAKMAIVATPQFISGRIVKDMSELRKQMHLGVETSPWMVANIHLSKRPVGVGFPLAWDNVIYDSPSLGYVVATHQSGPERGDTMITYYFPLVDSDPKVGRRRLLELGWKEWAEVAISDLERVHPQIRSAVRRIDIARWGHGMVRSKPGRIWGGEREKLAEPLGNILFAHTDLSGVALFEEAFYRGNKAARELAQALRQVPI